MAVFIDEISNKVTYTDYQDVGYGEYNSIHDYIVEPERIGYLKALIRAKKQVIQMLNVELYELERELEDEYRKQGTTRAA